jgi:outer membrane receptor protein involved in Fe transport
MKSRTLSFAPRLWGAVTILVAYGALFSSTASGQITTANFYGIVTDTSGAVVPGASVTLIQKETRAELHKTADAAGEFTFNFLRVGTYSLNIEASGFKTYSSTGIELAAGQQVRQTYVLEVGAVSETVQVQSTTPQINTVSPEQQQDFEALKVEGLPLARRNFSNILNIGTGVSMTARGSSGHGTFRMNGLGQSGTGISLDGTEASANPENRSTGMFQNFNYIDIISIDAIEQVQTVKGILPAEYGDVLGGQVNVITRSGTNNWHGSLFENFQAENLNARLQNLSNKPGSTFNQFGGSAGGPIMRDRIFIFGVYEGYREASFRLVEDDVPTAETREAMLRAVPDYNLVLNIIPLPNQPYPAGSRSARYIGAGSYRAQDNHALLKGDIHLGSTSNLALTYSRMRPSSREPRIYLDGSDDRTYQGTQERGTVNFITGGADWTSETRFGYNLNDMGRVDLFFNQLGPGGDEQNIWGRRIGRLDTTLGFGTPGTELWKLDGTTWSLSQKYARHLGQHSLKFGGKFVHQNGFRTNPENPAFLYDTWDDLLANQPSRITATFGSGLFDANMWEMGFFAQDDWRVSHKLVLNLGLRYDYFGHMIAKPRDNTGAALYNLDGLRSYNFQFGPFRDPDNPINSDAGINLGPRVGFAYNPDGASKTVFRGGVGVMFSPHMLGALWPGVGSKVVPFRATFSKLEAEQFGVHWPMYNDDFRLIAEQQSAASGKLQPFTVFDPNLQNPYSINWTFGLQRALADSLMLETAYVGNHGVKFLLYRWYNTVDRLTGLRPNPNMGEGYYVDNSQQTHYHSWQTSLRKRYSRHLSGGIHYTWAKALTNGGGGDIGAYYQGDNGTRTQDFWNYGNDRGPSTGDITHYFIADWVYDLPALAHLAPVLRQTIGGWQVSGIFRAQSGDAVSVGQSSALADSRADYIGGPTTLKNYRETLHYLNKAAFAPVPVSSVSGATIRPGNVGIGALRTPGMWNVDLSLAKEITFKENLRLQFRADAFNAFNHTNLTGLNTSIVSPFFGDLRSTRGARVIQLNARLNW